MSYIVLARKYRPQAFDEVIRQEHVTRTLTNAIQSDRVAHGILFSGPRGTGKTTIARILAKAMNCENGPTPTPCNQCRSCIEITGGHSADVFEIDGASNNGVDHIRELRENIKYMPTRSRYKIYIIDEVHMLSVAAFNALLKTLEEPPAHIMFFFATTEFHKIPITILSRCQRHDLRRIALSDIQHHMGEICRKEGIDIPAESLEVIARASGGSMRDGLSLLDQVMTCTEGAVTHEAVLNLLGVTDRRTLFDVSGAVFAGNVPRILRIVEALHRQGAPVKEFYAALLGHFRDLLIAKTSEESAGLIDAPAAEIELMRRQTADVSALRIAQMLNLLIKEEASVKFSSQPRYALEMIFIRMFQIKPAVAIEELIRKMDDFSERITEAPERFSRTAPDAGTSPSPAEAPVPAATDSLKSPDTPTAREPQAEWPSPRPVPASPAPVSKASSSSRPSEPEPARPDPPPAQEPAPVVSAVQNAPAPPPENRPSENRSPADLWAAVRREAAGVSRALASYLDKSRLQDFSPDGDDVRIAFTGNKIIFNQLLKHRETLAGICSGVFGRRMRVVLEHPENADRSRKNELARIKQLETEAINHPMVAAAVELFNGKVIQVKQLQEESHERYGRHVEAGPEASIQDVENAGRTGE